MELLCFKEVQAILLERMATWRSVGGQEREVTAGEMRPRLSLQVNAVTWSCKTAHSIHRITRINDCRSKLLILDGLLCCIR